MPIFRVDLQCRDERTVFVEADDDEHALRIAENIDEFARYDSTIAFYSAPYVGKLHPGEIIRPLPSVQSFITEENGFSDDEIKLDREFMNSPEGQVFVARHEFLHALHGAVWNAEARTRVPTVDNPPCWPAG